MSDFWNLTFILLFMFNLWKLFYQLINNVCYPEMMIYHFLFFKRNEILKKCLNCVRSTFTLKQHKFSKHLYLSIYTATPSGIPFMNTQTIISIFWSSQK